MDNNSVYRLTNLPKEVIGGATNNSNTANNLNINKVFNNSHDQLIAYLCDIALIEQRKALIQSFIDRAVQLKSDRTQAISNHTADFKMIQLNINSENPDNQLFYKQYVTSSAVLAFFTFFAFRFYSESVIARVGFYICGVLLLLVIFFICIVYFGNQGKIKELEKHKQEIINNVKVLQAEITNIDNCIIYLNAKLKQVDDLLSLFYSLNILLPDYKNIYSVSHFLKYFEIQACSQLMGPGQAYDKLESDRKIENISAKLDTIIVGMNNIQNSLNRIHHQLVMNNIAMQQIASNISEQNALISNMTECMNYNSSQLITKVNEMSSTLDKFYTEQTNRFNQSWY